MARQSPQRETLQFVREAFRILEENTAALNAAVDAIEEVKKKSQLSKNLSDFSNLKSIYLNRD